MGGRLAAGDAATGGDWIMPAASLAWTNNHPALVRRINQLYHDLTQDVFDVEHRYRHRVEREFWTYVAGLLNRAACPGEAAADRTVVDLACGTGFVTRLLGRALGPADRLIAIDLSTSALRSTGRHWSAKMECRAESPQLIRIAADGQQLPLSSHSVDLFAMNAGLHHVPDPIAALREIDRVLKPGGLFALGFEPNIQHFASPFGRLSHGFDRLAWYASPRQNVRRLHERIWGSRSERLPALTNQIEQRLLGEGIIDRPLTTQAMFDLVDPHARSTHAVPGFNPAAILRECFPSYRIERLVTSDYLGEAARRSRILRGLIDAGFRILWPARGSLLSWMIRKPNPLDQSNLRVGGQQH
jgi:SAM-dependent methyltransferase